MFSYDGPLSTIINRIVDIFILGVLWFIMCLPIITIGASTTAAYYVAFAQINNKDGGVIKKFFKSFIENFVQATIVFLIIVVISSLVSLNFYMINKGLMQIPYSVEIVIIVVQIFVMYKVITLSIYAFALLSKFTFNVKDLILTALKIGDAHIFTTVLNVIVVIGILFATMMIPVLSLISGGVYLILSASLLKRVFIKYKPDAFEDFDKVTNDDYTFNIKAHAESEEPLLKDENKD